MTPSMRASLARFRKRVMVLIVLMLGLGTVLIVTALVAKAF